MTRALVWFRRDLRLVDNDALYHAAREHDSLLLLYCQEDNRIAQIGQAQRWWLHYSLTALKTELEPYQHDLILRQGDPAYLLAELIRDHEIDAIYWNRCYEPAYIERDTQLKAALKSQGVSVHTYNANLLIEPKILLNKTQHPFKVFTPFWKACLNQLSIPAVLPNILSNAESIKARSDCVIDWQLLPKNPDWASQFHRKFTPGETAAQMLLTDFTEQCVNAYPTARDQLDCEGTSYLAPHLHFGELSPRQVFHAIDEAVLTQCCSETSAQSYKRQIGWREFSYYLLYHFPKMVNCNFNARFDDFPWTQDETLLRAWQRGQTGYPIVDAAMQSLWQTGYMHNRARMIVASFLTKDLLLPWQSGAKWFYDTLLDADLANNTAGWQWVAGSGADAAPYFRIFNPTTQSEKFNKSGEYIRRYLPILAKLPAPYIHAPSQAPLAILKAAGITLGEDYPIEIVNHQTARTLALTAYQTLKTR